MVQRNAFELPEEDYNSELSNNLHKDNKLKNTNTSPNTQESKTPFLDKFSFDLTLAAKEGLLDPVVGREREIERTIAILGRRKKNNPILIGEPGVGKTSIVEGLAQLIVKRRTTPLLFNKRLLNLDLAGLVAGTKYRGQFEERIKNLIKEIEDNPDVIVFIDEIHNMVGAGSTQGAMDAANLLKPALAKGTIQCIGATTLNEYRNSIEKDGALERRFQKVMIEPTTAEETIQILNNIKEKYECYHHVNYSQEAIETCVKLSERYITDRQFPDKAIDALDEAGSDVHLKHIKVPADIINLEKELSDIKRDKLEAVSKQNFELAARHRDRQTQIEKILEEANNSLLKTENQERYDVTESDIANAVSLISGVPVQKIAKKENDTLKSMGDVLKQQIVAQDSAIDNVVKAIQRNRVGLKDPNKPIGVFMFLGPTGVGKTYLAKKLSELMFGTSDSLIRIDMSEFTESFNTSRLIGAPPGYVGYDQGGQLTEKVRRHPYSIVLLDEIEKAHANVFNLLLQLMDEGRLTDGNGRVVNFRNTIIIMTSNAGTRQLKEFSRGIGFKSFDLNNTTCEENKEYARNIIRKSLSKIFAPEFINRLDDIIMFDQLNFNAIKKIVDIELEKVFGRIKNVGYEISVTDDAKDFLARKGYDIQFGARPLKRVIQTFIEDKICELIISEDIKPGSKLEIGCKDNDIEIKPLNDNQ